MEGTPQLAARLRAEDGYTFVEVLVALVLAIVVIGGPLTFLVVTFNTSNAATSRSFAARSTEVMLERLTRELREAQNVISSSTGANTTPVNVTYGNGSSSVQFYLPAAGSSAAGTQVTWTCTAGGSCTRAAGGTTVTELTGVTSAAFTPIGSDGATQASNAGSGATPVYPSTVRLSLSVQATSQADAGQSHTASGITHSIALQDGVTLRNYA